MWRGALVHMIDGKVPDQGWTDAAQTIQCPLCGAITERESGEVGPHFTLSALRPLRVTPRCRPGASLRWTGVVLADALVAAIPSRAPSP
jgi:hypothetical protein